MAGSGAHLCNSRVRRNQCTRICSCCPAVFRKGLDVLVVLPLKTFASMLQALLEAEGRGETWKVLGLPAAPYPIGVDGEMHAPIAGKTSFVAARGTRSTCSNRRLPRQQPGQLRAPTGPLPAPQSAAKPCDTKKARPAGQVLSAVSLLLLSCHF